MPPLVLTIIGLVQMAVKFAPTAKELYAQARTVFDQMFGGGLITIEQQRALREWADAHEAAVLAGIVPLEFTVEPDPAP